MPATQSRGRIQSSLQEAPPTLEPAHFQTPPLPFHLNWWWKMKGGGGWLSQRRLGGWRAVRLKKKGIKIHRCTRERHCRTFFNLVGRKGRGEEWGRGWFSYYPPGPFGGDSTIKNMILVWFFSGFFGVQFSFKQLSLPLRRLFSSFINTRNQEWRAGPADASKVTEQKPEGSLNRPERGSRIKGRGHTCLCVVGVCVHLHTQAPANMQAFMTWLDVLECDGALWLIRCLRRLQIAPADCFWELQLIYNQSGDECLNHGLLICLPPLPLSPTT